MNHRYLTPGKIRRLQTAASPAGVFRILAIDHRGVLLKMMDRSGRGDVPAERVTQLKLDIVRRVGPLATAVILDPQYSILPAIARGVMPGHVGLIASLESPPSTSNSNPSDRKSPECGVRQARQIGASGVKLYLAYHPDAGDRAIAQEDLVRSVIGQCAEESIPLFLEPVTYSIDPEVRTDSPHFAKERRRIAIESARRLGALGPDVLKLQFPVDGRHEPDEATWRLACAEMGDASPVPWALLSAGDPFDMFKTQLQIACEAGCSGFMAGRTVWSEAATAPEAERGAVLENTILPRMEELNRIADRYGHAWQEKSPLLAIDTAGSESY